jgi:hypothetical protein
MSVQAVTLWTDSQLAHTRNELLLQVVREVVLGAKTDDASFSDFSIISIRTSLYSVKGDGAYS